MVDGERVPRQRFPILFTGLNKAMVVLGVTQTNSWIDVSDTEMVVQLGWAFRGSVPRSSIRSVDDDRSPVWGWGAHGWKGTWLVNGSSNNIVRVVIEPAARARAVGFPVSLKVLRVSVADPASFRRAIAPD